MRARTAVVLLLGLAVLTAGSCSSGAGGPGRSHGLTFWTTEDNPARVKATQAIVDRFRQQTNIAVNLVPVGEDELQAKVTSASAAGSLPDVLGALSLGSAHALAADGITDPAAAAKVIDSLGRGTFSRRALSLLEVNGTPVAIPSDSWTQLLVYRKDLFDKAGLARPDTFEAIRAAAAKLTGHGMVGIVAATKPGDSFTEQTFEYLALANGCQLTDRRGNTTLTSKACVDTFAFYVALVRGASVPGEQDADTTRAAYLQGKAAMAIWSSFLLDELAGLSDDVRPTCPQCRADTSYLGRNSGIVTAIKGTDGEEPSQFGELTSFAIAKEANHAAAAKFVQFMMSDGYVDWLALAPEGKFPVRTGTEDEPGTFVEAWNHLKTGVGRREALSTLYPKDVLHDLATSTDTMKRWGFSQGQGRLAAAQLGALPVPQALAAALDGTLTPATAAEQAQAEVEKITRPLRGGR